MGSEQLIQYNAIVQRLLEAVPEYKIARIQQDDSLPNVVFGDFAIFLQEKIKSATASKEMLDRAFELFNSMGESSDSQILNLLAVSVFKILSDDVESITTAKKLLSGKALALFDETLRIWNKYRAQS